MFFFMIFALLIKQFIVLWVINMVVQMSCLFTPYAKY